MTEHGGIAPPRPMMEMSAMRDDMGSAIAEGEIDVRAQVTMVFAISPDLQ